MVMENDVGTKGRQDLQQEWAELIAEVVSGAMGAGLTNIEVMGILQGVLISIGFSCLTQEGEGDGK